MHLFSVLYWDGSVKKEEASISQCSSTSCSTSGEPSLPPLLNNLKETDLLGIIIFLFTIVSLVLGFSLFRLGTKWRDQKAARLMAAPDHDDHFEAAE